MTDDDRLARALHDAVSDIEPRDALAEIRSRTRTRSDAKVATMSNRTWPLVLLGAAATAAVIGVVAFVGGFGGDEPDPGPAASSSQATEPEPSEPDAASPSASPTEATTPEPSPGAVPLYFIGDTDRGGPRLYREFQAGGVSLDSALDLLTGSPLDSDYRTAWPTGAFAGAEDDGDVITVRLADSLSPTPDMSEAEAEAAVQQVVYTVQAVAQRRAPVQFTVAGGPAKSVFGVDTAQPVSNAPILGALSHMNITTPEQGATVSGTLELSGVANSFEASSGWELRQGDKVVKKGVWMAEGWMEEKLFPFEVSIDLAGVAPGDYSIWATTDDPTGGTEGVGAMSDDKDITIK